MPRPRIDDSLWMRLNQRRRSPDESVQEVIERLLDTEDSKLPADRVDSADIEPGGEL